jgi:hypothetical protein
VTEQQVVGTLLCDASEFSFQVTVVYRDSPSPQGNFPSPSETDPADVGHRTPKRMLIVIIVSEHKIAEQIGTFINNIGACEITAVDKDFGPFVDESPHRGSRSCSLVMGIG